MKPDFEKAATIAAETLIKYGISSAPVSPLPILKKLPGVLVLSYEKVSNSIGSSRDCILSAFGEQNQDACTSVNIVDGQKQYLVTYNQYLPAFLAQHALARELGHILLGHDGTRPEQVRNEEAICFANHLLSPRALIKTIQAAGIRLTVDVFGSLTGCYENCLFCMRKIPATHVAPELNRIIRGNFMPYIMNFFNYQRVAMHSDVSALADFGSFMEGYAE